MPKSTKSSKKSCEYVGFIYGGDVIKTSVSVFFHTNNSDFNEFVKENFCQHYGENISGRVVKCEDSEASYEEVIEKVKEEQGDVGVFGDNIFKISCKNAVKLIKEVTEQSKAQTVKVSEKPKKETKKKVKDEDEEAKETDDEEEKPKPKPKPKPKGKGKGKKAKKEESDNESDNEGGDESEDEEEEKPKKRATKKGKGKKKVVKEESDSEPDSDSD